MNVQKLGPILAIVVLFLGGATAQAETLTEALTKAYQTSPSLMAARAGLRAQEQDIDKARALWRPKVSVSAELEQAASIGKTATGDRSSQSQDWVAGVNLYQPMLSSGRNGARRSQAEARVRAAQAGLTAKEQSVLVEAATAYVAVARNEEVMDLVRDDINVLRAIAKEQSALSEKGRATDSDLAQVQAALDAARATCLANLSDLQNSLRAYAQIMGEPPEIVTPASSDGPRANVCIDTASARPVAVVKMPTELPGSLPSLEAAEQMAKDNAPTVTQARASADEAQAGVKGSIAEFLPEAGIGISASAGGEALDGWSRDQDVSISASIRIPIYNGGVEYANLRTARERDSQAKFLVASSQREAATGVSEQWHKLVSVRVLRRVTRDQAASLERAFNGLRAQINTGKASGSVTDLIGLRGALLATRIALIDNSRQEVTTVYKLLAAMGTLTPETAGVTN
jgi:outer membrane protein